MTAQRLRGYVALSFVAAVVTLGLKFVASSRTQSVGLLSDAIESCVNLLCAVVAYISLWYSSRPIDNSHTYGHEKIEYFSSGLEGLLIAGAAIAIAVVAADRFFHPIPLMELGTGAVLSGIAALINAIVGTLLLRAGRQFRSIVLEADGQHLLTDVWTSLCVLIGLGLAQATGEPRVDAALGIIVAGIVLRTGILLVARSFDGLMDHAIAKPELKRLRELIRAMLPAGTDFHMLRTRQSGARQFIDFHFLVPGDWSVREAHDRAEVLEMEIHRTFESAEFIIHIEPIEGPEAYQDNRLAGVEPLD